MRTAVAWLALAVLMSPLATAAMATTGGRNCSGCGFLDTITYPFGIGPGCSLPGFSVTCVVDAGEGNARHLLLGNQTIDLYSVGSQQSSETVRIYISYSLKMIRGVRDYSVHWESAGRAFAISRWSNNSMFVFGCGIKASLFIPGSGDEIGNCSVGCVDSKIMERLPYGPCVGIGCCVIPIQVNLRAFTLNISRTSGFDPWNQVTAFVTSSELSDGFRPGEVLDLFGDSLIAPAELDWAIPYKPNCKSALEDRSNYACISNNSKCLDSPIGGYICQCLSGYGNPYVLDGCQQGSRLPAIEFIQPETDCPTWCGNVSIPLAALRNSTCTLHVYRGPITNVPHLADGTVVTGISTDEGVLQVREVSEPDGFLPGSHGPPLYALSDESGVVKWAFDHATCEQAKDSDYRCFSPHSDCVDVTDDRTHMHLGYRCKCSVGFEGNPYLKDGCTGVTIGLSSDGGIIVLAAFFVVLSRRWKKGV
uniref:EGF-like domain-containing protein n=1 Tax=Oryza barthii TaxID=65489 RepID=A0A0D3GEQ6_9ORYZ